MAYSFATNQGIRSASVVSAAPMTFSCRCYTGVDSAVLSLIAQSNSGLSDNYIILLLAGTIAGDPVRMIAFADPNILTADSTTGFPLSEWLTASGIYKATNEVSVFLNGSKKSTTFPTVTPSVNSLAIGYLYRPSPAFYLNGLIAEASVWYTYLLDSEIASLAKGFSPRRIRPQSLVFYTPLLRNLQDLRQGLDLTAVNSPTVANHPRVY